MSSGSLSSSSHEETGLLNAAACKLFRNSKGKLPPFCSAWPLRSSKHFLPRINYVVEFVNKVWNYKLVFRGPLLVALSPPKRGTVCDSRSWLEETVRHSIA